MFDSFVFLSIQGRPLMFNWSPRDWSSLDPSLQSQKETNSFEQSMTNSVTIGVASLASAVQNGVLVVMFPV
jgi:ABC-type spermidine/putrescine transport system permease subunit II